MKGRVERQLRLWRCANALKPHPATRAYTHTHHVHTQHWTPHLG